MPAFHAAPALGSPASSAPTAAWLQGKERYVFFSFPHIAIDSSGEVRLPFRFLMTAPPICWHCPLVDARCEPALRGPML